MRRFDNISVFRAAVEAYGEEEAAGFMENCHRGSVAQAVKGDPNDYVDPRFLDDDERRKMLSYLESVAQKSKRLDIA